MAVRLARQGRNVAIVTIDDQAKSGAVCTAQMCGLNDEAFAVSPDHPALGAHHGPNDGTVRSPGRESWSEW